MSVPIRIALCEDTEEDAERLLRCIDESGFSTKCRHFLTCEALAAEFVPGQYDLIFLDIYVDGVQQGVDVATQIRDVDAMVTLVFTTYSTEHTLESYRLKAIAYMEKPVRPDYVKEILAHVEAKRKDAPSVRLLIDGKRRKIPLESILYFEQREHVVFVNTLSGVLRTSQSVSLRDIEPLLPDSFYRSHQSYIANLRYVKELDQDLRIFRMQNGDVVYIRRPSIGQATKIYERWLFAAARGEES